MAQLNPTVGDLEGNLAKLSDAYDEAEAAGCDIVAFPELSTTGYPPEDLVLKPGFVDDNREMLGKFARLPRAFYYGMHGLYTNRTRKVASAVVKRHRTERMKKREAKASRPKRF